MGISTCGCLKGVGIIETVVLASRNENKLREIARIMKDAPVKMISLMDYSEIPEIEETGTTFAENALIKARTVFQHTGYWTLSDDSGLEVDALNGAPGVYSARYSGEAKDNAANNSKLLAALENTPADERGAQFRCVVAIVGPDYEKVVEGIIRGKIGREMRGSGGFGYDPLFFPDGYHETFAELDSDFKNEISHRAIAFKHASEVLLEILK